MCKELAMMEVSGLDNDAENQESSISFKKLIITRCQKEFEKNPVNEKARIMKLKEIEECTDPVSFLCIIELEYNMVALFILLLYLILG